MGGWVSEWSELMSEWVDAWVRELSELMSE